MFLTFFIFCRFCCVVLPAKRLYHGFTQKSPSIFRKTVYCILITLLQFFSINFISHLLKQLFYSVKFFSLVQTFNHAIYFTQSGFRGKKFFNYFTFIDFNKNIRIFSISHFREEFIFYFTLHIFSIRFCFIKKTFFFSALPKKKPNIQIFFLSNTFFIVYQSYFTKCSFFVLSKKIILSFIVNQK